MRWVALLRGINVGGVNKLPMADLRETVVSLGYEDVATYIQSGNVAFEVPGTSDGDEAVVADRVSSAIAEAHAVSVPVMLRTSEDLVRIADTHPDAASGLEPQLLHVFFLDAPPTDSVTGSLDSDAYAPDGWTVIGREVYVRYPNGSARSKLTIGALERAFGVTATARNLNTVRKLARI